MFASIYIPDFFLQAVLRHTPALHSQAVALIDPELPQSPVVECTAVARSFGVGSGLTASQALARCRHLEIKVRSPGQETLATEILLQTAQAFSPCIESTKPGVCTLELKGLGLIGDDARSQSHPVPPSGLNAIHRWSQKIQQSLESCSLRAKIGIGPTPDLALLAAQGTEPVFVIDDAEEFVAQLPVTALAPPPDILEILRRWGIHTAGEFLALEKGEVTERLGAVALELFERVSPLSIRPLRLVSPSEQFWEQIEFESEVETLEPILLWLRRFTEQLTHRLEAIYLVVGQLQLQLGLASGDRHERIFKVPSATGKVEVLVRMMQTHLETVSTKSPVVSLRLGAIPARSEIHQFGLFQNTLRNPNQFAETLARLFALAGTEKVGTPAAAPGHRPDSFRMQRPNFEFVPAGDLKPKEPADGLHLRRFRPPLPAQLEFQADQPARLASALFNGVIAGTRGPFLSSGNWWDDSRWAREEWDVETADGALLRLFRSSEGCFVEGVYD